MVRVSDACAWSNDLLTADLPSSLSWSVILAPVDPERAAEPARRVEEVRALPAQAGDAFALDADVTSLPPVVSTAPGGAAGF
jgi:hypothetical protein